MEIGNIKVKFLKLKSIIYLILFIFDQRSGLIAVLQDNVIEIYSNNDSFCDYIWRKEGNILSFQK
jgi:hypothetical protein